MIVSYFIFAQPLRVDAIIFVHPSYLCERLTWWKMLENVGRNKFFVQMKPIVDQKIVRKQWCRFTFTFFKVSIKIWERKWLIRFAQIFPIFASLLSDIRGMEVRGWKKRKKKKPFAFHRDFHLPDWLGVGRETELALKRRIVRGQSTEEVWNKKGNHLRPVSRSQITRLPGKGAGMLSVLAAVSRGGMLKGQESIWHSRAGYEIAVCLVKWMGWFRIIGNGCRRVDI